MRYFPYLRAGVEACQVCSTENPDNIVLCFVVEIALRMELITAQLDMYIDKKFLFLGDLTSEIFVFTVKAGLYVR